MLLVTPAAGQVFPLDHVIAAGTSGGIDGERAARISAGSTRVDDPAANSVDATGNATAADAASALMAPDTPVYYALSQGTDVYHSMSADTAFVSLEFQEPVSVLSFHGPWLHIRTRGGSVGYVRSAFMSDVWIRVVKSKKTVYVYRGETLESEIPADMAYNFFADKKERGDARRPDHWRTPEGRFYVVARNPDSQFHRAWVLNYPTPADADRGLKAGLINQTEFQQIRNAAATFRPPPMGTALGGFIEIHGSGTGTRTSWTRGCVAIPNAEMDRLWDIVKVGTPVVVEP